MSSRDSIDTVRMHYDADPPGEYARIDGRPEFLITMRFMQRYFRPGERILDVGGGPGRYTHALAKMGCDMTLVDLSPENVRFACERAADMGLSIAAHSGDARHVDEIIDGEYDHALLMGPLYHLQSEADRERAVNACLKKLKPGGTFWASFISMFSGIVFMMANAPGQLIEDIPVNNACKASVLSGASYTGKSFTDVFFIDQREILPFMRRFPMEKLHLFGQEGILSPCEKAIFGAAPEVRDGWVDFAEKLAEREELLSWSEHLMYVGRKKY